MTEDVLICSAERSLVGVLTTPDESDDGGERPVVIILNAGLLHRVGPNRIYVKLARALAGIGFSVLRLDLSGIGESQARSGTQPIDESVHDDVRNAMDTLARTRGASRFVLMGHCSGAAFSLLIAARDPRVTAAVIINPEMASEEWNTFDQQRKVANYYANFYGRGALTNRDRLIRLLSGKADYRTIAHNLLRHVVWNRIVTLAFRVRQKLGRRAAVAESAESSEREQVRAILRRAGEREIPLLFLFTEGSTGHEYLRALAADTFDQLCATGAVDLTIIPQADHIFNLLASQRVLVDIIQTWAQRLVPQEQLS